jgi:hypothetical protein
MIFCPGSKNSINGKTARYDRIINELCHFYKVSLIKVRTKFDIYVLIETNKCGYSTWYIKWILKLVLVIFCISWKLAIGSINDIYETLTRFLSMKL